MYKHIVLVGLNFQPNRSTGDKNYWVELVPLLAKRLNRITVLSVRKHSYKLDKFYINGCNVTIKYIHPRFLETPDVKYSRPRIFWRKGAFPSLLGVVEKKLNISRIADELKSIYREYPFDHIHLMDNFGLGNKTIVKIGIFCRATTSVSAMAYQGKNPFWYHLYLKLSYNIPNLFVVSYSLAFQKKLIEIGLAKNRIRHIPWGVVPSGHDFSFLDNKHLAKKELSLSIKRPLFLWAGYIQQIQKADFLFAFSQARKALREGLNVIFYFAFKPEAKLRGVKHLNNAEDGIIVKTTTVKEFNLLKKAADVFFSPVCNKNVILAPPLTWIEVMGEGTPILTTNVGGVDEVVEDGETGFVAKNKEDLVERLFDISSCYKEMRENCYRKVREKFDIRKAAKKYLKLWGIGDYDGI